MAAESVDESTDTTLVFGQTGVRKGLVAARLADEITQAALAADLDPDTQWDSIELEDGFPNAGSVRDFVRGYPDRRQSAWLEACTETAERISAGRASHRAVFLHGFYWYRGELFNHIDLAELARLRPTRVVTLIDDVFDVHSRIMAREDEFDTGAKTITIPELATWRWAEIGLADLVARNLPSGPVEHYVLPVKHSAKTMRQLLLDRSLLRVYASFPISRVRRPLRLDPDTQAALKTEIDDFRERLRAARFVVLDPVAIDEYRFDDEGQLLPRWDTAGMDPMVEAEAQLHPATEQQLADPSVAAALNVSIQSQIKPRDLFLVRMADAVACYRPAAFDGRHSAGTAEEIQYALHELKRIVVIHDEALDGGPYGRTGQPFGSTAPSIYSDVPSALHDLEAHQQRKVEQRRGRSKVARIRS